MMPQADKSFTEIDVRRAGMDLLARREHTRRELLEKLTRRFGSSDIIQSQVDRLSDEGLQSDERFVEAFVHYRQNSGKGPLRIIQELKQKGVSGALIEAYVDPRDDVWFDMAKSTLLKKFGAVKATSANEKAKRARFLQYRGFSSEMVFRLI
jgi:regulatory protein